MGYLLTLAFGIFVSVAYGLNWSTSYYESNISIGAEVSVNYFLEYRTVLIDYLSASGFSIEGSVPNDRLVWPHTVVEDPGWANVVLNGQLYVYSTKPLPPGFSSALRRYVPGNVFLGEKMSSGFLKNLSGDVTFIALPEQIPVGSIVFVGD